MSADRDEDTADQAEIDPVQTLGVTRSMMLEALNWVRRDIREKNRAMGMDEARMVADFHRALIQDAKHQRHVDEDDLGDFTEDELIERVKRIAMGEQSDLFGKGKRR